MTIYNRMLFSAGLLRAPDDGAGGGGGGGAGDAGAGGGGSGDAGGQQSAAGGWFDKLSPEDKQWAESKGWKADTDTAIIADSYKNLEKLFGADKAGRTLVLPKDAEDKAALDAIYDKLGRPKDAKEYEIEVPEGVDPTFAETTKTWFHQAGLTKAQAKAITENYKAVELDALQKRQEAHATEVEGLQKEWGADFDKKTEVAKAAVKAAGLTDDHVKALEFALGPASATKLMEFFGRNYVEAGPPGGEQRSSPGFGALNPVQAKGKMDQLYSDPAFMSRYGSNDPKVRAGAMAEMDALAKLAANAQAS